MKFSEQQQQDIFSTSTSALPNNHQNDDDNDDDQQEMLPTSSSNHQQNKEGSDNDDQTTNTLLSHEEEQRRVQPKTKYNSTDVISGGQEQQEDHHQQDTESTTPTTCLEKLKSISRHGLGIFLIILVAIVWVSSSEFLQFVFGSENFDKPYFVTYFNTMSFGLWMFGFACPGASGFGRNPWKKKKQNKNNTNDLSNDQQQQSQDYHPEIRAGGGDVAEDETAAILGNDATRKNSSTLSRTTAGSTRRTIPITPPALKTEMRSSTSTSTQSPQIDATTTTAPAPPQLPFGTTNDNSNNNMNPTAEAVNGSASTSQERVEEEHQQQEQEQRVETHSKEEDEEEDPEPYSVLEVAYAAFLFCPLWFFANVLFNYSLTGTSVASNTILSSTSCIWAMLFSRILLKEPVTVQKMIAILVSFGGAIMVGFGDTDDDDNSSSGGGSSSSSVKGNILAGVSAMFYAAYTTVLRHCLPDERRYPIGMCFAFVGLFNALLLWPGLALLSYLGVEEFEWPSGRVAGFLVINGLIGTNLSDILWAKSVILTSPVIATLGLSLTIPVAMIADLILRGEWHSILYLCGAVCVTAGFVIANLQCNNNKDDDENENEETG